MEPMDLVSIGLRWLHILAAVTIGGGLIYQRLAVVGISDQISDEGKAAARRGWSKAVAISVLFLIASGLANLILTIKGYKPYGDGLPGTYHMLFGIKFLLALGVFFFASILSGKSENAQKFQANTKRWLNITIVLVVAIVCISGVLRQLRTDVLFDALKDNPPSSAPADDAT